MTKNIEQKTPIIKSVTLENIGPFHASHVEFTSQWNVLLGDNGMGKTTFLKAIAAALCGIKADLNSISQLLRVGAQRASIHVRGENNEFLLEFERDHRGSVKIVHASPSPLIYDEWLVLGFPAVRVGPSNRQVYPTERIQLGTSTEDLLPLLQGELDHRVFDIKQWLVNLDYQDRLTNGLSGTREVMLDFFRVLQRLTPDVRFEFETIDFRTNEIIVVTDSGAVPLHSVNQGTSAMMSWIGTLFQRLIETGKARNASCVSGLVLVDEPDAHMHPHWQQMFIDLFRQEFPSIQIIATTHSPLMISALKPHEIHVLRREPKTQGPVVVVDRIDIEIQGRRADQILTSSLFGLESTLDPETLQLRNEYTRLLALEKPSPEEQAQLAERAQRLKLRLPTPHETETARRAFELIEDFAKQRLATLSPDQRQKIMEEIKVQLKESITGSKRP